MQVHVAQRLHFGTPGDPCRPGRVDEAGALRVAPGSSYWCCPTSPPTLLPVPVTVTLIAESFWKVALALYPTSAPTASTPVTVELLIEASCMYVFPLK